MGGPTGGADKLLQDALVTGGGAGGAVEAALAANRRRSSANSLLSAGALGSAKEEVVEIISQNDGMKSSLKRLSDILTPFLNDENTDVSEFHTNQRVFSVDLLSRIFGDYFLQAEMMDEQEQVRQEQDRHMYLLHRNVNGLRANLDLAQTVAANKVQNHLSDNQNLLKEVNNLRFEVRNLSMENQRLIAQLEFNNRMQGGSGGGGGGGRGRRGDDDSPTGDRDESDLLFPQYRQQPQQLGTTNHGNTAAARGIAASSGGIGAGGGGGGGGDGFARTTSVDSGSIASAPEGVSFDSNGLRSDADYFNSMRGTTTRAPKGAIQVSRKVSKSASTPFFSVKAVHSDPAADGARLALSSTVATGGNLQQDSVGSKRTIAGVPSTSSYLSLQASHTSQQQQHDGSGGGSVVVSKNEYARSADEKIAALMELNEQQIRALKEEQQQQAGAAASASKSGKLGKGTKTTKSIHMTSVSQELSYLKGEKSLELLGAPAVTAELPLNNFSLTSDGSGAFPLPNIRKNSGGNGSVNKRK